AQRRRATADHGRQPGRVGRGAVIDLEAHGLIAPATPARYPGGPTSAATVLSDLVDTHPDHEILIGRNGRYSSVTLDDAANRVANVLRAHGVAPGDRVAMSLPNDTDIVVAFLGTMRAGAMWLGINRALAPPEKQYVLADSGASVYLGDPDMTAQIGLHLDDLPELDHVITVDPGGTHDEWYARLADASADPTEVAVERGDPAALAYTSGTTGFPKGVVHTHHNLLLPGAVAMHTQGSDWHGRVGVALPLTILNLMVLGPLAAWQRKQALVAMDRIDAVGIAEWVSDEAITTFSAVPSMVHDLLTHDDVTDEMLTTLDGIGVGGADMPDAFRRMYQERFGRPVGTGYGLTEAPTAVTVEDPAEEPVPGTCGKALPQVEIVIRDPTGAPLGPGEVGEVCVAPSQEGVFADVYRPMLGYWNRPDESAESLRDGLLNTGDLGMLDADGHLFIKDRKHDLVIRGGANVYPAEVERVLHDDARVAACAVFGVPDERLGERLVGCVQLVDGALASGDDLIAHCVGRVADYKVPDELRLVDDFVRTPMGKIKKTVLRDQW
ncbi:MAG: class I adenylate-forming enzyme family protein, partial [Acidimicrobiales bacterium]